MVKISVNLVLKFFQIFFLISAQIILSVISWFYAHDITTSIYIISFIVLALTLTTIIKLTLMYRQKKLDLFVKTQTSFVIPYAILISEIYLYAQASRAFQEYEKMNRTQHILNYAILLLVNFTYSLVCLRKTSSKQEYISYMLCSVVQLCLLSYSTVQVIGFDKIEKIDQLVGAVQMQGSRDLNICFLAMFIGNTLITMDYLNKTQETEEEEKEDKVEKKKDGKKKEKKGELQVQMIQQQEQRA